MTPSPTIRPASAADATAIVALIESVAHYFLNAPSGKGAEAFLSTISETAILGDIADPRFRYLAAYLGEELAGVAALRDNRHVYHLFVSPSHHRQGLATSLWQHIQRQSIDAGNIDGFTVNSSLYAVPVYRRWGFIAVGDAQIKDGIAFQPMRRPVIV